MNRNKEKYMRGERERENISEMSNVEAQQQINANILIWET